ncbi:uncharacterized protein LOC144148749 isoform X1 [Haemaphysalis longicornis]
MPATCVAFRCSNTYATPGTSFHSFPKCEKLKRLWVLATKRANWWPSKTSLLCSAHFKSDDFTHDPSIVDQLPRTARMTRRLKPGAVPSVFAHSKPPSKPRGAFEKRRHQEIINSLLASHQSTQRSVASGASADTTELPGKSDCAAHQDAEAVFPASIEQPVRSGTQQIKDESVDTACIIAAPPPVETASKEVQANLSKVTVAHKFTLTSILLRNWGVQTQKPPTLVKPAPSRRRRRKQTRRPPLWWLAPYL